MSLLCFFALLAPLLLQNSLLLERMRNAASSYTAVAAYSSYSVAYNSYANVTWETWLPIRVELHCHTTESDGHDSPSAMISSYKAAGFGAVGISDHNRLTFPWANWGVDSSATGMVAIPNSEVSRRDCHIIAPFGSKAVNGSSYQSTQDALTTLVAEGAFPIVAHPSLDMMGYSLTSLDGLSGFQGIEIYNALADKGISQFNFRLWDHLLTNSKRNIQQQNHIWGISSDDAHSRSAIKKGWILVYAQSNTLKAIQASVQAGSFVAVVASAARMDSLTQTDHTFTVSSSAASIIWKANGEQIVGTDNSIDINCLPPGLTYIRAELSNGNNDYIFTQPIFLNAHEQLTNLALTDAATPTTQPFREERVQAEAQSPEIFAAPASSGSD